MIYELAKNDFSSVRFLFENFQTARAIVVPALEQKRGTLWVDNLEKPSVARYQIGDINFFAGDYSTPAAKTLVKEVKPLKPLMGQNVCWDELFKDVWSDRLGVQVRTKFSGDSLDVEYLKILKDRLSNDFILERIDLETVKRLDKRQNMHIPMFFGSSKEFIENGIGFCIKHEGKVVSMASTFTPFIDEFEIQVMTNDDPRYRRKGLATAVSAALIIYALDHDLIPQWDAANEASVQLAQKLGYSNPIRWNSFYVKSVKGN